MPESSGCFFILHLSIIKFAFWHTRCSEKKQLSLLIYNNKMYKPLLAQWICFFCYTTDKDTPLF